MRIVIKIGTSTLTHKNGCVNIRRIETLCKVISDMKNAGNDVVMVSSGAIGMGVGKLSLKKRPDDIPTKQAAAAVGQCELMYLYDKMFSEYNNTVAQILLTKDDIAIPRRKRNTQSTFNTLLEMGIIPVVNENDTVSTDEIEIGDNDNLSAMVAELVNADLLVLFSDIDGLYDHDPHIDKNAKIIPVVEDVESVRDTAGAAGTKRGTGGMVTKLDAAERATHSGINMIIANGNDVKKLYDILEGKPVGTLFVSKNYVKSDKQ